MNNSIKKVTLELDEVQAKLIQHFLSEAATNGSDFFGTDLFEIFHNCSWRHHLPKLAEAMMSDEHEVKDIRLKSSDWLSEAGCAAFVLNAVNEQLENQGIK